MFAAIGRWFKALGYLLTGQLDAASRAMNTDPRVVRAKYDDIIRDKVKQIDQYKQAVAGLIAQQERKMVTLKKVSEEVAKLERLKAGALAKAKQTVEELQKQGRSKDEIHANEDYAKCLSAYSDFSSTLAEKEERVKELEGDVANQGKTIGDHKVQLQALLRDVEKLRSEASEALADIITSKQEKELADTINGISQEGSAQELTELRELRQRIRAEASISKQLAGTDARAQEAEFLEFARSSAGSTEFDSLIGLVEADTSIDKDQSAEQQTSLPE